MSWKQPAKSMCKHLCTYHHTTRYCATTQKQATTTNNEDFGNIDIAINVNEMKVKQKNTHDVA